MSWITDPNAWAALLSLTALEIILGIDNIVFIAIMSAKLPEHQRSTARRLGLAMAMFTRIGLLFCLTLIMRLTAPLFTILGNALSGRDLILLGGGLFLLMKATMEIHDKMEGWSSTPTKTKLVGGFSWVIIQIMILDIIFSFDSIITAIGLANQLAIMVTAIVIAVIFMLIFINTVSEFVETHPTIKLLALSFLLLIGVALIGEGLDMHIPKGYIYFAMAFSTFVEMINMRMRKKEAQSQLSS